MNFQNTFSAVVGALIFSIILSLLATFAEATDIQSHFNYNCKGSYLTYTGVEAHMCARAFNNNNASQGALSIRFLNKPAYASTGGWYATRDGNNCGTLGSWKPGTGSTDMCLHASGDQQFAGASWDNFATTSKRGGSVDVSAVIGAKMQACEGAVRPSSVVLADGHAYDVGTMEEEDFKELYWLAAKDLDSGLIPERFARFEVDAAGVPTRVLAM